MSDLTITMTWKEGVGTPSEDVILRVDCDQSAQMKFKGPDYSEQTIEASGFCTIHDTQISSDVELVGNCPESFEMIENVTCDYEAWGFYVGVPAMGAIGMSVLIALFVAVAYRAFK